MTIAAGPTPPSVQRIWDLLDARLDALVDLAVDLGATPSPHGRERTVADKVVAWLEGADVPAWLQPITDTSANAVGRLRGTGGGPSLLLNAHLDTGPALPADLSPAAARIHGAWVDDGLIYGFGVVNDKGQLAALMAAAAAIAASGVELGGDLWVAGVAFETGAPSIGDRQGVDWPGEGFGSWWLVNRGVTADFALVAETSSFGIIDVECGVAFLEITTTGRDIYTPRLVRRARSSDHPSSVLRMADVVHEIERWAVEYEAQNRRPHGRGHVVPKAQIVSVTGSPRRSTVVLDVRLLPGAAPTAVAQSVLRQLTAAGIEAQVEVRQWSRGYFAEGAQPLVDSIIDAHRSLFRDDPSPPPDAEMSMWRDMNIFNELGIPSVCYGPPRQRERFSDAGDRAMRVEDLLAAAKVYAATALSICGQAR